MSRAATDPEEPLTLACKMLDLDPASVLYVGDDLRDIESGRDAGTKTAAAFGYINPDDNLITGALTSWSITPAICAKYWITRCAVAKQQAPP